MVRDAVTFFQYSVQYGMRPYANHHGNSGVTAYEAGVDFIRIRFRENDAVYLYNYQIPGKLHVEKMKLLAKAGQGLSTYISRNVQDRYFKRES